MHLDNSSWVIRSVLPPELQRHRRLSTKQAAELAGFSVRHFRRITAVSAGEAGKPPPPRPIRLGLRKDVWEVGEILDWMDACKTAALGAE